MDIARHDSAMRNKRVNARSSAIFRKIMIEKKKERALTDLSSMIAHAIGFKRIYCRSGSVSNYRQA